MDPAGPISALVYSLNLDKAKKKSRFCEPNTRHSSLAVQAQLQTEWIDLEMQTFFT